MNGFRALGVSLGLVLSCFAFAPSARATDAFPVCLNGKKGLGINNAQVHVWKTTTPNQYLARGHVHGTISRLYPTKNRHAHFEIEFDGGVDDTLEVVYSLDFGKLPRLALGMEIEACGDYITSSQATSQYPPSPDGAIIHWIHKSTSRNHASGFLAVEGRVYGGATR
jgi:hypothetical protein